MQREKAEVRPKNRIKLSYPSYPKDWIKFNLMDMWYECSQKQMV